MHTIPDLPIMTRRQLLAIGWTDPAIARALRSGRLVRPARGVLARPGTDHLSLRAAALVRPDAAVSHRSALAFHDLPIVGSAGPRPQMTVPPGGRVRGNGMHLYRATLPDEDVCVPRGIRTTAVARTVVDVARHRPLLSAVAAGDAALHRRLTTEAQLDAVRLRCWNWPRIGRAHRVLALLEPLSESPLESISRVTLDWLGLPPPLPQRLIFDRYGTFVGRVDFYWDHVGVVGEADGAIKYGEHGRQIVMAEKEREAWLEELGLVVVRWSWEDVAYRRHVLKRRIMVAFERASALNRSGLCRSWSVQPPRNR